VRPLRQSIVCLVQAARQFYIKFANVLKDLQFTVSYADPCLFYRDDKYGKIILVIHIDDCYVVGDPPAIKMFIQQLYSKGIKTKVSAGANDYLSCEVIVDYHQKVRWIGQPTLLKKLEKKFGDYTTKMGEYTYKTPGTPGFLLVKSDDPEDQLSQADQKLYRSGVGTLLQYSNKTRPEMSNAVRELSKGMDKAPPAGLKEMYRVIKYLLNTKTFGLKLAPTPLKEEQSFQLTIYSDSDWASDRNTRKSTTGFIIFLQDAPILWKSQSQKTVSLSSTKAEYYALSEAAKEVKFISQVLESLGLKVTKPIIVYIDNVGAIFVAENPSATKHTRHIDARYHFVREYIIDGHMRIIFVQSKNNRADIFTKNVSGETHIEHVVHMIIRKEIIKVSSEDLEKIKYFEAGGVSEKTLHVLDDSKYNKDPSNMTSNSHNKSILENYLRG
jgi:hypothetical protein